MRIFRHVHKVKRSGWFGDYFEVKSCKCGSYMIVGSGRGWVVPSSS